MRNKCGMGRQLGQLEFFPRVLGGSGREETHFLHREVVEIWPRVGVGEAHLQKRDCGAHPESKDKDASRFISLFPPSFMRSDMVFLATAIPL